MFWSGILALLGLAVTAVAQGNLGIGDTSACAPTYSSFQYVGCYGDVLNGGKAGFQFRIINSVTDPKGYPGWTGSASLSVDSCTTACRAHGYKFALTYAGVECWCAPQLPFPATPASGDTSNGPGAYAGTSPGTPGNGANCNIACPANNTQICGGSGHGSVYADQSFQNETSPASLGVTTNYGYHGCYVNSGGGPSFVQLHAPSTISCQNYCGALGYAFSTRNNADSPAGTPAEVQELAEVFDFVFNLQLDIYHLNHFLDLLINLFSFVFHFFHFFFHFFFYFLHVFQFVNFFPNIHAHFLAIHLVPDYITYLWQHQCRIWNDGVLCRNPNDERYYHSDRTHNHCLGAHNGRDHDHTAYNHDLHTVCSNDFVVVSNAIRLK
ncbi:MAG: hypothetical protein Q9166_003851 [cf. Caloplaca sp. 2 TL-2023]